ncbi:hypothetical protein AAY473_002747 [Plecturocebus cupreus]
MQPWIRCQKSWRQRRPSWLSREDTVRGQQGAGRAVALPHYKAHAEAPPGAKWGSCKDHGAGAEVQIC